jgi:hypothetical protein
VDIEGTVCFEAPAFRRAHLKERRSPCIRTIRDTARVISNAAGRPD